MRVLLLSHGLPPENVGGVEMHVAGLARELAALGHDVHVLARTSAPGNAQGALLREREGNPTVTRAAYRWEGLASFADVYRCPPMADSVAAFLRAEAAAGRAFDVAHVHHLTGMSTGALAVLRAAGIPVVLSLHDYWLVCPRGQMFHRDEELCERVEPLRCGDCIRRTWPGLVPAGAAEAAATAAAVHDRARALLAEADRLVVPSPRALPPFVQQGVDPARVAIVEYGIDTAALRAVPPPAAGPGPLRVGFFGTLIPSKGVHVLAAAIRSLPAGTVELRLHGNAVSYHGDAGYLVRLFGTFTPGGAATYFGPYAPERLPALLADVDVVASPALWAETYGIAAREGMAAGRPALVSRIGGLQDAVTDGVDGRVLAPGDVAAWAEALQALAADRGAVRAMGRAARRAGRDFADMARQLAGVYAEAAGR